MILTSEEFSTNMDRYLDIVDSGTEEVSIRYKQKLYEIIKLPAQMTIDELKAEVQEATEQLDSGKGTSHEDFIKEMENW